LDGRTPENTKREDCENLHGHESKRVRRGGRLGFVKREERKRERGRQDAEKGNTSVLS